MKNLRAQKIRYVTTDVYAAPSGFTSTSERWFTSFAAAEKDAREVLRAREAKGMAEDTLLTISPVA